MSQVAQFLPVRASAVSGVGIGGAEARFFESQTTTPVTVYSDAALTVPHPTPLVADGEGVFPAVFWTGATDLKAEVRDPDGVMLNGYPIDPVAVTSLGSAATTISFAATPEVPAINVQAAIETVAVNLAALEDSFDDLAPGDINLTGPGLVGRTVAGAGVAGLIAPVEPITLDAGLVSIELDGLTEEATPDPDDLFLLELASDGAKRKVKFSSVALPPTTSEVLTATAGATAGAVGSYAFLATSNDTTTVNFGDTIAGSSLLPAGVRATSADPSRLTDSVVVTAGSAPAGTWRCVGYKPPRAENNADSRQSSLFLRIS
jgi:hypothetical protein